MGLDFSGRVVLVTGGTKGIGRGIAAAFAAAGAGVVVCARTEPEGESPEFVACDVRDAGAVKALIEETVSRAGRIDYLFNNAGIAITADARDYRLEHWKAVLDVNLLGVIHGVQAAYPGMARQGHGHIVNTSSLAGLLPYPTNLPYTTTKHAVVGLSLSLRAEAADLGVKVSVVCPGWVQSGIYAASPMLNVRSEQVQPALPFKSMEADAAARRILTGVARNQPIIVFPAYARMLWWGYRMRATWLNPLGIRLIRDLRRLRAPAAAEPDRRPDMIADNEIFNR